MATGGPYTGKRGTDPGFDPLQPPADESITGRTDAQIMGDIGQFADQYSQGDAGMMDQGQPPANIGRAGVEQGIAASGSNMPAATQQQGAPQQGVDPATGGRAGGGFRLGVQAPNYGARVTQADMVPSPDLRTVTHAGQSFSMDSWQPPAAAIGLRLQQMDKEQQDLSEQASKLFADDNAPKVIAPYRRAHHRLVDRAQRDYIDSIKAQYGGNESQAMKSIIKLDPNNPQAHTGWMQLGRDMDDLGEVINYDYAQAEKYIDDVNNNVRQYDEESYNAAKDLVRGFSELGQGGYGDVQKLTQLKQNYRHETTLPYFLSAKGKDGSSIDQHIKDFMANAPALRDAQGNSRLRVNKLGGGFTAFTQEDAKVADSMIDALVEDYYPLFKDRFASKEAFSDRLHKWYPVQVVSKMQIKSNPKPAKAGADSPDKISLGLDTIKDEFAVEGPKSAGYVPGQSEKTTLGGETANVRVLRIRNSDGSDFSKPVTLNEGKEAITMFLRYVQEDAQTGRYWIVGHSAEQTDTKTEGETDTEKSASRTGSASAAVNKSDTTSKSEQKRKALIRVPVEGNEKNLELILRGKDWKSYFGGTTNSKDPLGLL